MLFKKSHEKILSSRQDNILNYHYQGVTIKRPPLEIRTALNSDSQNQEAKRASSSIRKISRK